ncbi:hypothetical protein TRVL_02733 [Trypanosoma vivax]|nr:hypothetical protein TRVL_02733 [Trypanosoma vivax]
MKHSPTDWACKRDKKEAVNESFESLYSLLFVETEFVHTLRVSGTSTTTVAWLSQPVVDFGACPMNDYRDVVVQVHNGHKDTPLHFKFPRVAYFSIEPYEGRVVANSTCDVRLSFRPRRLGVFNEKLDVVFNETCKASLSLSGVAASLLPQRKPIGGINKLPQDFKRPLKLVQPTSPVKCAAAPPSVYANLAEVDLGMLPAEGLDPIEPEIPTTANLRRGANGISSMREGEHLSPVTLDAQTLIRKVYKEAPANASERRDCRRELQPMDLLRIAAPIKALEFQRVTVGSSSTKPFFLYNGTGGAILATMPVEESNVTFSPQAQVIPPSRAGVFDVTFCSSVVQAFKQVLQLTINSRHLLRFTLQADVVPVEVSLSRDDVALHFSYFSEEPVARSTVVLSNHGNNEALYTWVFESNSDSGVNSNCNTGSPFAIDPMSGSIPPLSKVTANVTFSPPFGILEASVRALLQVKDANKVKMLNISGFIARTNCVWSRISYGPSNAMTIRGGRTTPVNPLDTLVELYRAPVGKQTPTSVMLQNRGANIAFFSFEGVPEWLTVSPANGRVGPCESEEISLVVYHELPELLRATVTCCVRGMTRPLKLTVTVEMCVASLDVVWPERRDGEVILDFGTLYIGTEKALPVQFRNTSEVSAVILVDLRQNTEYSFRRPEDYHGGTVLETTVEATASKAGDSFNVSPASLEWCGCGKPVSGLSYITIPPMCESTVLVVYRPVTVTGDDGRFFVSWRHIGASTKNPIVPLAIAAKSLPSRVAVTPQMLEFPCTVVGSPAIPMQITIENACGTQMRWRLMPAEKDFATSRSHENDGASVDSSVTDTPPRIGQSLFRMNPSSGVLAPFASQQIHATFVPRAVGFHSELYGIYVDEEQEQQCADLRVSGSAARPRLLCNKENLVFPAIPLNVSVRETIYITNDGFDSIEVFYNAVEPGPLTVTFPRGSYMRLHGRIPVEIVFSSSRPVSFASSITFTSNRGETLTLPFKGTSIGSFLTVAPYVLHNFSISQIAMAGWDENWMEPFLYSEQRDALGAVPMPTPKIANPAAFSGTSSARAGRFTLTDATWQSFHARHKVDNLRHWLNYNVFVDPVSDLITSLQQSDGRMLIDSPFGLRMNKSLRHSYCSDHPGNKSLNALDSLTSLLKSYGACLNEVHLPYLMAYDNYVRYMKETGSDVITETEFGSRAFHSWMVVLLQFIRVVFLPKLDLSNLLGLYPGLRSYLPMDKWDTPSFKNALRCSNVFSPEESLLLHWVAHNLRKCVDDGTLKCSFRHIRRFEDLNDCVGVASCIFVFVPSAAVYVSANRLVSDPTSQSELEANARALVSALTYVGLPIRLNNPFEVLDYGPMDWLLLVSTLFLYLPRFIPSGEITMEGKLLEPTTRSVEVSNTSKSVRVYTVEMSNPAFRATPREFTVDPGNTVRLQVEVMLRFGRPITGECILIDSASDVVCERVPMVFHLKALPNNEPLHVIHLQVPLYNVVHHEVQVDSPFPQSCVATLRLSQGYENNGGYSEGDYGKSLQSAFYVSTGVLPFSPGDSTKVSVQFAPCARGKYEARLTFHDAQQGEFSILLIGECIPPKPTDKAVARAEINDGCCTSVMVKLRNVPFERMISSLENFHLSTTARGAKGTQLPDLVGVEYSVMFVNESFLGPSPFFSGPEKVMFSSGESALELPFSFRPKFVGEYNGFIVLASVYDVRTIQLNCRGIPVGEKSILRFSCPARQCITQRVPIVNTSRENWLITATIEGDSFSGPRELSVQRGKSRQYPLRYSPAWVASDTGSLVLLNNETGERRTYILYGEAEEPLSEDMISVECKAREKRTVMLAVPEIQCCDTTYSVEMDLSFARGPSTHFVARGTTSKYELVLSPLIGGTYTGRIIFRAPGGRFVWYAIEVIVNAPEKEGTVNISTETSTPVTADVSIHNPTNKTILFSVLRFGSGLFGENTIMVDAGESAMYSLLFVPSHTGSYEGRLAFCNEEVGEFWYEVCMNVVEAVPEDITFSSEISVPQVMRVRIPNNTATELQLFVTNTNTRNFSVVPSLPKVPPYSQLTVDIVYKPTAVDKVQEAMIKLFNHELGEWRYACRGVGRPPAESAPVECVCEVWRKLSVTLKVRNPFEGPFVPRIRLVCDGEPFFSISPSQNHQPIAPGSEGSISLIYAPGTVGRHDATVFVSPMNVTDEVQDVVWKFPLRGFAEWRSHDPPIRIRCTARCQAEETIRLKVPGLVEGSAKNVTVTLHLETQQQYAAAVRSSLFCKVDAENSTTGVLLLNMRFVPLRPFIAMADLVVRAERDATWRHPVVLEATRAEYDDVLTIRSPYRTASVLTFEIYNVFPHASTFAAFFTPDSSRDLSIGVARGVLQPFIVGQRNANAGTTMQVIFAPSARVPQVEGTLVVDTEEMQWLFKIIGKLENRNSLRIAEEQAR